MSLPKSLKQEQKEEKEAYLKARDAEKLGSKESSEKVVSDSSNKESKKSKKK